MLEILAKCLSFYSFVGLVGLICWVGLPIGWEHRCHHDLQILVVTIILLPLNHLFIVLRLL